MEACKDGSNIFISNEDWRYVWNEERFRRMMNNLLILMNGIELVLEEVKNPKEWGRLLSRSKKKVSLETTRPSLRSLAGTSVQTWT